MLYALAAITFDPAGHIQLPATPQTTDGETRRRMSRIATLDGGAVVTDGGFSQVDRVFELEWPADDAAREAAVRRMVELYPQVLLAAPSGVYLVALESYVPGPAESSLRALVVAKLSA